MNTALSKSLAIAAAVAVVGYLVLSFAFPEVLTSPLAFALGALLSGLAVTLLNKDSNSDSVATTTLYVGNLPYRANEAAVRKLFSEYANVKSVRLLKDKQTGKRRGFGFVEVEEQDANKTISELNDFEFMQRTIKVREAKSQPKTHDTPLHAN